jgi:hypothetical protein
MLPQVPLPVLGSWLRGCWLLTSMTHSASTSTIAAAVPVHAASYMLSLARAKHVMLAAARSQKPEPNLVPRSTPRANTEQNAELRKKAPWFNLCTVQHAVLRLRTLASLLLFKLFA